MPGIDAADPKYEGQDQASLRYLATHPPLPPPPPDERTVHRDVRNYHVRDVWGALLVFRVFNALALTTFFQPDEFYQALEPAWQLAFGEGSGAWITWEWHNQLRSSIHPILLAAVYQITDLVFGSILPPILRTKFLLFVPKVFMGLLAALQDYYIWGLAERVYGVGSVEGTAAIWLTALSPWQWFVSTRAFANSLETTLTVMALYYWPWGWMKGSSTTTSLREKDTKNLKISLSLAAFACTLRPTNIVIWITLLLSVISYANQEEIITLIREASVYGSIVLVIGRGIDRLYYGTWTFPAANFLRFNLTENLAVFYGKNRPDYYFTEGIPLLLTSYSLLFLYALFTDRTGRSSDKTSLGQPLPTTVLRTLTITALTLPASLSLISHKEVRFIYPILPILLVVLARPAVTFLHPFPLPASILKRSVFFLVITINVVLAIYVGCIHNSGVMSVTKYLRREFELHNEDMRIGGVTTNLNHITVGFLMPCHSVPWRSHFVYAEIDAWALTCEPPLGLSEVEKSDYKDEADQFYEDPRKWVRREMGEGQPRPWPQYLVFFEQLEKDLRPFKEEGRYEECWRRWNSAWHDDPRRKGDIIVWCNDPAPELVVKDMGVPGLFQ